MQVSGLSKDANIASLRQFKFRTARLLAKLTGGRQTYGGSPGNDRAGSHAEIFFTKIKR